jgi:hypothetical protein
MSDTEKMWQFEPKMNNRFIVYMETIPTWAIKSVIRPVASIKDDKYIYSELVLEMFDAIEPSTSQKITDLVRAKKTSFDEIILDILGPIGDVVEKWRFINSKVVSIEYSKLDWKDSNPVLIKMILTPEQCVHEF